jgi:hypothetical protein
MRKLEPPLKAVDVAWHGFGQVEARLERTASRLARLPLALEQPVGQDAVELSAEMVSLLEARHLFQVNARVLKTAFEMEARLLDVLG